MAVFARTFDQSSTDKRVSLTIKRTQRCSIHVVLRYRITGESRWRSGVTKNMSASGILMEFGEAFAGDTAVELGAEAVTLIGELLTEIPNQAPASTPMAFKPG